MTNNETLAQALEILSNECCKHSDCSDCPLSDGSWCSLNKFGEGCMNGIVSNKIRELREGRNDR